jgi:hypothetical protein
MVYFNSKNPIWVNFEVPWNGKFWYFFGYLEYFTAIWYILWPLGRFCGLLLHFWYVVPGKIWQP